MLVWILDYSLGWWSAPRIVKDHETTDLIEWSGKLLGEGNRGEGTRSKAVSVNSLSCVYKYSFVILDSPWSGLELVA